MVECFLAKEDVAGSTPVSRSKKTFTAVHFNLHSSFNRARYPSGKGEVCKTFMRRFDPDPRLHYFRHLGIDNEIQFSDCVRNCVDPAPSHT